MVGVAQHHKRVGVAHSSHEQHGNGTLLQQLLQDDGQHLLSVDGLLNKAEVGGCGGGMGGGARGRGGRGGRNETERSDRRRAGAENRDSKSYHTAYIVNSQYSEGTHRGN